ncbi:MAG: SDR family NAD(P)-dependent oxidoreductase [Acidimicrobiales bacterium]
MDRTAFDLSDHVAVVTGAGRGIGEGIAKAFARAGAAVVVAARRTDEIDRVATEIDSAGGTATAITTDVTDPAALEALADGAVAAHGSLTTWVNNAGGSPDRMPLTELDRDSWDRCLALNLTAVWEASVAAEKRMADGGCIINISSMAAYGPVPGSGHYAAAKAATNSLTQTMARELAPRVRVNGLAPGVVPTEIMKTALGLDDEQAQGLGRHIPMGRVGTPDDLGQAALYLASPAAEWVTGQTLNIAGGQ